MPVRYRVFPELNVVLVVFQGDVRVEDNIEAFLAYTADPLFKGRQNALLDLEDCAFPGSYFKDMQRLAYRLAPYYAGRHPDSRTSIFAPGDLAFGMSRMYASAASERAPYPIDVFRHAVDALRFAELDPQDPRVAGLLRSGGGDGG